MQIELVKTKYEEFMNHKIMFFNRIISLFLSILQIYITQNN